MISAKAGGAAPAAAASARGGRSASAVLTLAVWFAMAAAIVELSGRGIQKFVLGRVIEMSRDAIWLAPAGQLMLLLPIAAVLLLAGVVLRRQPPLWTAVGAFSFVVCLGVLVMPGWLTWYAALLLAAGAGIQSGRVARARPAVIERVARSTLLPLVTLLVLAALASTGVRVVRARSALAALPAARAGAPNVIVLIWDTVRARSLSLYGHDRATTPNLEAYARNAVVFDRAFAASSWTLPSHGAMFTGQPPHRQSSTWVTPLDDTHPTLAEMFQADGYLTAGFVANTRYADWEHGLARGFMHYEDYIVSPGEMLRSTALGQRLLEGSGGWDRGLIARLVGYENLPARKSADRLNADFLRWLDRHESRPVFAFLNYFDAHQSYVPPREFSDRFPPARAPTTFIGRLRREVERSGFWDMTPDELVAELAAYEASIAYLDDRFGNLMREMDARGQLDNTIIVVASDHGEEFKEHGGEAHGTNLYSWQTHVPLLVAWEGRMPHGLRVQDFVSLLDLPATIADLAMLSSRTVFPGASLMSYWQPGSSPPQRPLVAELSPGLERADRIQSITVAPHQLFRNEDGSIEVYDVVADPLQQRPLPVDANGGSVADSLTHLLDDLTRCDGVDCCCSIMQDR